MPTVAGNGDIPYNTPIMLAGANAAIPRSGAMRRVAVLVLLWCGLAGAVQAGTILPPQPTNPNPTGAGEEETPMGELLRRGQKGVPMQVDAEKAARCQICGKALYLHSDADFTCEPVDKDVQHIEWATVPSPLAGRPFAAAKQGNVNHKDGFDRDFCRHSVGRVAVHTSIWMCPESGYAAPAQWFGREFDGSPLSPETITFVQQELTGSTRRKMIELMGLTPKPGTEVPARMLQFNDFLKSTEIPDWIKYENALKILERGEKKLPHYFLGKIHLEAAHANRRYLCSELGVPGLNPQSLITLGQAIRRMNMFILAEAMEVRRQRREDLVETTERDPDILAQAAARVIEKGERVVQEAEKQGPPAAGDVARFNVADMFVLYVRHSGFLARQGYLSAAAKALGEARKVIPSGFIGDGPDEVKQQMLLELDLLRRIADDREAALTRERVHLYRAADYLMQALYFGKDEESLKDLGRNAYLVGELLRRDGREPESAYAWLLAAQTLLQDDKVSGTLEKVNRAGLITWAEDGLKELEPQARGKALEANVARAVATVVTRAGARWDDSKLKLPALPAGAPDAPAPTATATTAPVAPTPGVAQPPAVAPEGQKRSRAELYHRYYEAFRAFAAKNGNENPKQLADLVAGGFMNADEACLDAEGRLHCPATGAKLLYMRGTKIGSEKMPLLYPRTDDPDQAKLWGDGRIAEQ
ncbi:MAG: hypothetical protein AMXMBFR7_06450 [Planctomycetota bacterium]